jgi:hypothetical protein
VKRVEFSSLHREWFVEFKIFNKRI